ncbi:sugar phosphate isomerase/epimerase [Desulfovibrio sp. OttesenSCG-928-O18]|nr:sugar phosphate isomerase/epimerase [Desulfovibrio sp. OttesenSCG-928-O18]
MPCFINLPLRWLHDEPAWVDWFVGGRIAPELGLDGASIRLPDTWHEEIAARFRDAGLPVAVHLPFLGIDPCDLDDDKARSARAGLTRGAELARLYGAKHMIGHPYYRPRKEGREKDDMNGRWMEMGLLAWPEIPAVGDAPLFLENTYERGPEAIAALVGELAATGQGFGVCFDVGHWHSFAGHSDPQELDPWLEAYGPFAVHLHLHDNDGSSDQHIGLGKGGVPFTELFARLASRGKAITATLEPHDVKAFSSSIAWLRDNKDIAARIGWETPRMEALPLDMIQAAIQ